MLLECGDRKLALLVNDVGEINVDASLVKAKLKELDDSETQLVELSNGCICCSIQGDLASAVTELVTTSGADHIVIEASGVAEPTQLIQGFYLQDLFGNRAIDIAPINALVTVIDSGLFLREWKRIGESNAERNILRQGENQPVFELMIEQIECADYIVLNKRDLLEEDEELPLLEIVSGLNGRAQVRLAKNCGIVIPELLGCRAFRMEDTIGAPRWMQELEAISRADEPRFSPAEPPAPLGGLKPGPIAPKAPVGEGFASKYGLHTFIYRRQMPFKATDLAAFLHRAHPGVLRVKGFAWIAERWDQVALVSVAGDVNRCDFIGDWWVSRYEQGEVRRDEFPDDVERAWQEPYGDRRQEIVFIGIGMDEDQIVSELEACCIRPEEHRNTET